MYQVIHNTESTRRQDDLKGRAVALGWQPSQVRVIDVDEGSSGASAADRAGFQQLVGEVSLGRAGIVLGPGMLPAGPRQRRLAAADQDLRAERRADLRRGRPV